MNLRYYEYNSKRILCTCIVLDLAGCIHSVLHDEPLGHSGFGSQSVGLRAFQILFPVLEDL